MCQIVYLRNSVGSHFMTVSVQVLNLTVVSPFVGNVECSRDWTTVGIHTPTLEEIGVKLLIQVVDGIVESQQNDLRDLLNRHISFTVVDDE